MDVTLFLKSCAHDRNWLYVIFFLARSDSWCAFSAFHSLDLNIETAFLYASDAGSIFDRADPTVDLKSVTPMLPFESRFA